MKIVFVVLLMLILAPFVLSESYGVRQPLPTHRKSDVFRSKGNKEVTFAEDGNILWYGAVDPNLLEVAGSGALY